LTPFSSISAPVASATTVALDGLGLGQRRRREKPRR
jgi:hypothetical protein